MSCFSLDLMSARKLNMYLNQMILLTIVTLVLVCIIDKSSTRTTEGVQLLTYDASSKAFSINPQALELIRHLKQPIQVISAIGDARVGKSTAMNILNHIWSRAGNEEFVEVFQTGGSVQAVTRGVWMSILQTDDGTSRVLLDVEGTDLGNDATTDHLSMFTALMSSGMTFFIRDAVKTHAVDFLFRMSRLSDGIFKEEAIQHFPKLKIILREALDAPDKQSMAEYVKDAFVSPNIGDGSDEKRKIIGKYFPRNDIEVSEIDTVQDRKLFKNMEQLSKSEYMNSMQELAKKGKLFPVKKSLNGAIMDGPMLAELAGKLIETMNNNTWRDFGNAYLLVEKNFCDRCYEELVKPYIGEDLESLKHFQVSGFKEFEKKCALAEYVQTAKAKLTKLVESKAELEATHQQLKEEILRRKNEEERRATAEEELKNDKDKMEEELRKAQEERAMAEEKEAAMRDKILQQQEKIKQLEKKVESNEYFYNTLNTGIKAAAAVYMLPAAFTSPWEMKKTVQKWLLN